MDEEMAELSKLRCTSLQTEEIAKREREKKERQARRNNRYTIQIALFVQYSKSSSVISLC